MTNIKGLKNINKQLQNLLNKYRYYLIRSTNYKTATDRICALFSTLIDETNFLNTIDAKKISDIDKKATTKKTTNKKAVAKKTTDKKATANVNKIKKDLSNEINKNK